jgi:hypothetical protein
MFIDYFTLSMCSRYVDLNLEFKSPTMKLKSATASGSNLSVNFDRHTPLSTAPIMSALEMALFAPAVRCTFTKQNVL